MAPRLIGIGIWDGLQMMLRANGSDKNRHEAVVDFAATESAIQAETPSMLYPEVLSALMPSWQNNGVIRPPQRWMKGSCLCALLERLEDSADALRKLAKR